jgi:hypothetical protein
LDFPDLERPDKWFPKGQVHMDRSRSTRTIDRFRYRPGSQGTPGGTARRISHTGIDKPADRPAEDHLLIDGLGRPDISELEWSIGGAHHKRDTGQISLHHRGVELSCRGSTRGQEHRRATGGQTDPE